MSDLLTQREYKKLLADLQRIIREGKEDAERAAPQGAKGRRFVAHLFYAFNNQGIEHTFLKGRYLNQELVSKGFAKMV